LCLGVFKHRATLATGAPSFCQKKTFLRWIFAYVVQFKILKFPEHVCLTACVGLPDLPPSGPHNLTSTGPHFS